MVLFSFIQEQSQITTLDQMRGANIPSLAAMEQTRMLAHTLAQNEDPKFQVYMLYYEINVLLNCGVHVFLYCSDLESTVLGFENRSREKEKDNEILSESMLTYKCCA